MQKVIIWIVVLAFVCCLGAWALKSFKSEETSFVIGFAIGNLFEDQLEMHIIVSPDITGVEGQRRIPLASGGNSVQTWDEWIAEHFNIIDSAGQKVTFRKVGFSNLITEQQAHSPEFFISGKVRARETYTVEYIPFAREILCYRQTVTVTAEGQPFKRHDFPMADKTR
ncbi:MAG: hypothetical protein ABIG44_02330 [Planctomycetota bacterium]